MITSNFLPARACSRLLRQAGRCFLLFRLDVQLAIRLGTTIMNKPFGSPFEKQSLMGFESLLARWLLLHLSLSAAPMKSCDLLECRLMFMTQPIARGPRTRNSKHRSASRLTDDGVVVGVVGEMATARGASVV